MNHSHFYCYVSLHTLEFPKQVSPDNQELLVPMMSQPAFMQDQLAEKTLHIDYARKLKSKQSE